MTHGETEQGPHRPPKQMTHQPPEILHKHYQRIIVNHSLHRFIPFNKKHFGFWNHCSTQDALNIITNYINTDNKIGYRSAQITTDMHKAFNKVGMMALSIGYATSLTLPIHKQKLLANHPDKTKMHQTSKPTIRILPPPSGRATRIGLNTHNFQMYTDGPQTQFKMTITNQYPDDVATNQSTLC